MKPLDLILKRLQSPGATIDEICELIRRDYQLTETILKLANSAYYAIPGGVSDLNKALHYVGLTTILKLVITQTHAIA